MGAKVQGNNYFPGYYSMRDLNEDANSGSWSLYYENKALKNVGYCNGFTPRPTDGYSNYDKEVLKKTMLMHEAIFRKQVHELHRLYRIQRDLMDELKKKELYNYSLLMESSQSSPFLSQMPSEDTEKIWQMPTLPLVNSSCGRPSTLCTNNVRSPLNFLKENSMKASSTLTPDGHSLKDSELLNSKVKKFQRTFDLQLPADEYIDSEDGEETEEEKVPEVSLWEIYPPKRNRCVEAESDVKLTLGSGGNLGCGEDNWKADLRLRNNKHGLTNLNEPIKGICSKEAAASASVNVLGLTAIHVENQWQQGSMKPNSSFLVWPQDTFKDNQKIGDHMTCSSSLFQAENKGSRQEWLSYNLDAGQSRSNANPATTTLCHEKFFTPSKPIQVELPPFLLSDQSKKETWLRERPSWGIDISQRNCGLANSNHTGPAAPLTSGLFSVVPQSDVASTSSPFASSWRKPTNNLSHIPVAVQALPCNDYVTLNTQSTSSNLSIQWAGIVGDRWQCNGHSLDMRFGRGDVPCQNDFNHEFQSKSNASHVQFASIGFDKVNPNDGDNSGHLDFESHSPKKYMKGLHCTDVKCAKDMNLNMVLPNGCQDGASCQVDLVDIDVERKHRDPHGGLFWLKKKSACNENVNVRGGLSQMDLGFLNSSQLMSSRDAEEKQLKNKVEAEKDPSSGFMQNFTSPLHTRDAEAHNVKLVDSPCSKNVFGSHVLDKPHISKGQCASSSSSISCWDRSELVDIKNSENDRFLRVDLSDDLTLPDPRKQLLVENPVADKSVDNGFRSIRDHINLNTPACEEQPIPLKNSSTNESGVPSKSATEIDLEVPIISQVIDNRPLGIESPGTDHLVMPVQLSGCEIEDLQETFVRTAAEAIVALSSCVCDRPNNATCLPLATALRGSLDWFAEVVSCNACELEISVGVSRGKVDGDNDCSDDGVDFFESMTLKLIETKTDEYLCKPRELEVQKEEMAPPPLLTRPRKVRTRRGRQRKDFQKDILPGLVSLSRHEMTEDLQTFGELMRASGCSWQTGFARRNTARNGWNFPTRGRRRSRASAGSRGSAAVRAGTLMVPPPRQPRNSELELKERSLKGWGKTTRRPRRQRLPTGNALAPFDTV